LRIADSSLILGHRLSEWCGHGPVVEEDIALANVALDLIGQARLLYTHAAALEGKGRDEDDFAFCRSADEFRNVTLVELPNGDYGHTILRNFLFTAFQRELWSALQTSEDTELARIARKSLNETRSHLQHASDWTVRLGDGTDESHTRLQQALDLLWPFTAELFSNSVTSGSHPAWPTLESGWLETVRPVLDVATLQIPQPASVPLHGKQSGHSAHLEPLLAEMQYLQRTYPGRNW
jgi:ring-1,2-phenylacetyl-CoA epoxidase subunit PaaC